MTRSSGVMRCPACACNLDVVGKQAQCINVRCHRYRKLQAWRPKPLLLSRPNLSDLEFHVPVRT